MVATIFNQSLKFTDSKGVTYPRNPISRDSWHSTSYWHWTLHNRQVTLTMLTHSQKLQSKPDTFGIKEMEIAKEICSLQKSIKSQNRPLYGGWSECGSYFQTQSSFNSARVELVLFSLFSLFRPHLLLSVPLSALSTLRPFDFLLFRANTKFWLVLHGTLFIYWIYQTFEW